MESRDSTHNEMSGTTQFLNEASVKTVTRVERRDIPDLLRDTTRVGYTQDIHDFFYKPLQLASSIWSSQIAGATLMTIKLPEDAFLNAVLSNKLTGYFGFRGTAVVRLQVNGMKFQAGRLLMVFVPQGQVLGMYPLQRIRSLMAATQLPRVELDLASETEVVMKIPYISPTPFYNLNDRTGPLGKLYVLVYSPLATGSGGSTSASITLWNSFEDVELVTPAVAQSGNITEKEQRVMGIKPISGGLRLASKAATMFSAVPSLSSIAGPASWVLDCLSGVAAAFGYSKPSNVESVTKVVPSGQFHMQNFNGSDNLPSMGLDGTNKLSILPGFAGTDLDEMSLNHLVQIPAFLNSFTWSTSGVPGAILLNQTVDPMQFFTTGSSGGWTTKDMVPVSYFTRFFDMYRGSIVFTFKIVKTSFHSGRLLITFNPGSINPTYANSDYLLREVLDIRETSEFRFVVPYVSTRQYTLTDSSEATGFLKIFILNELVAPDTVANSVEILMEVSGGPDYELAFPSPTEVGYYPLLQSGWTAQSGVPSEADSSKQQENQKVVALGSANVVPPSLAPATYCVGEKINSILQLLKRYVRTEATILTTSGSGFDVRPFVYGFSLTSDTTPYQAGLTNDYFTYFSSCFAYARGGVRLMLTDQSGSATALCSVQFATIYPSSSDSPAVVSTIAHLQPNVGTSIQVSTGNSSYVGGQFPSYQRLHSRLNRPSITGDPEPVDVYSTRTRANMTNFHYGGLNAMSLYRAAADDYTLGYFIGVPLLGILD